MSFINHLAKKVDMKRVLFVVLVAVMVTAPCLAEVEPDGIFSIEGTRWTILNPGNFLVDSYLGFFEETIYDLSSNGNCSILEPSFYIDLLGVSFFYYSYIAQPDYLTFGFMFSYGIGFTVQSSGVFLLHSPEYDWSPPPECMCEQSGGIVETRLCCETVEDFPNLCLVGACTCTLENSHEVLVCDCPEGYCWNEVGDGCVPIES